MKYGIPVATLVLVGAIVCLHRAGTPARAPEARPGDDAPMKPVGSVGHAPGPSSVVESPKPDPVPSQKRPEVASVSRAASGDPWKKLFLSLDRELRLTPPQQEAVDQILKERDGEIRGCHEAIRKSGVLDMRHYEWQVALMKGAWFRRIDSLLDTVQHERFVAIVEQGFFNDGLAFTHEPGMTVLD